MVFSIDPNVKGAISESFDKSHLSESFDIPAGCSSYVHHYRPQRSWGKVMFLHVSVILFTGRVVSQHALQVVSQHVLQQVSGGGIPACLAGFQAHTQGEVEGSGQGGLQAHTQGES